MASVGCKASRRRLSKAWPSLPFFSFSCASFQSQMILLSHDCAHGRTSALRIQIDALASRSFCTEPSLFLMPTKTWLLSLL